MSTMRSLGSTVPTQLQRGQRECSSLAPWLVSFRGKSDLPQFLIGSNGLDYLTPSPIPVVHITTITIFTGGFEPTAIGSSCPTGDTQPDKPADRLHEVLQQIPAI
jgi:hypothetical protein